MLISLSEAIAKYGPIVNGRWANETQWCKVFQVPDQIANVLMKIDGPTRHIYCNVDMHEALGNAFQNVIDRKLVGQLRTFDGAYTIRDIRSEPGRLSTHSYGLAIDINAATNKLGTVGDMTPELVKCFTDCNFIWGGTFLRKDYMHYQFANW